MQRIPTALAAALTLIAGTAAAAPEDMTLTPATNGAVVIQTPAATPALRVQPTGAVQLPQLPGATPGAATDKPVCHDASGTLLPCDPTAIGTPGPTGASGMSTLVSPTAEPAGANCATGGVRLQYGLDANGNGALDAGELNAALTRYVCNGAQGPQGVQGVQGAAGTPGAAGTAGTAGANGKSSLVLSTAEAPGANCSTGGVRLQYGLDANGNGVLDAGEVNATRYVCHGAQGPQGIQGIQGPAGTGGVTGLAEVRHGCFAADRSVISGTGYAVAVNNGVYTVTFTPALGAGNYTLMLDARTSTGRALAVTTGGDVNAGLTFTPGWLAADGPETIARICFVLAR